MNTRKNDMEFYNCWSRIAKFKPLSRYSYQLLWLLQECISVTQGTQLHPAPEGFMKMGKVIKATVTANFVI